MTTHPPTPPTLSFFASVRVDVGSPLDLGAAPDGHRRLVPITGGSFEGPGLRGRVLAGGADHQVLHTSTFTEVDARYALETDDGARIAVHNVGVRTADAADIAALVRGEAVDPDRVYFRSAPRMSCAAPALAWVSGRLFVAVGQRLPDRVLLDVFEVG